MGAFLSPDEAEEFINELKNLHDKLGGWEKVEQATGINRGHAWKMARGHIRPTTKMKARFDNEVPPHYELVNTTTHRIVKKSTSAKPKRPYKPRLTASKESKEWLRERGLTVDDLVADAMEADRHDARNI